LLVSRDEEIKKIISDILVLPVPIAAALVKLTNLIDM